MRGMYQLLLLPSLFLLAAQVDVDSLPSHSPPFQSGIDDTPHESLISRYVRAATRRACDSNDKTLTVTEVIQSCNAAVFPGDYNYNFTVKNVNIAEWNDFTATVEDLTGMNMQIDGSPIAQMDFDKIKYVFPKALNIANNPNLVTLRFAKDSSIDIEKGITITKNDKLEKLDFGQQSTPATAVVPLLTVKQNRNLKTIDGVERFADSDLVIRGNPTLENAVLLKLSQLSNPNNKTRDIQQFGEDLSDDDTSGLSLTTWIIISSCVGVVLLLIGGGVTFYCCHSKKKSKTEPRPVDMSEQKTAVAASSAEQPVRKRGPVPHLPLELTAIDTVYDPIPLTKLGQKQRLGQLVEEILEVNPLEFLKVVRRLFYTLYLPMATDSLGQKMKDNYARLTELYGGWRPAFPVVPVDKVEQDMGTGAVSKEKEAQKLWDAILSKPGSKKIALCLWSHDDLDSIFHFWAQFFTAETAEELARIEKEEAKRAIQKSKEERGAAGKGWRKKKKNKGKKRGKAGHGSAEQKGSRTASKSQLSGAKLSSEAQKKPVRCNFTIGNIKHYVDYLYKKYEPAGKEDEGMVTVFPFYILKEFKKPEEKSTWTREQLSFVVASAWMARALGEDKYLTFRALHWAKKQQQADGLYVLCDKAKHQEENVLIAQCLYDHIMDIENNDPITFLGACRLICAGKKKSWDNGNMLLFLQRNILHWAVDAGVLKPDDKRFKNWDNIYRCMLLRSQATPATKVYDPDNLPCPKDLWSIPYKGNEKQLAPVYINDYEPKKPNGIWRCDLGAAAPEPRTMAGFLGAPEPARYIDKPIGFEAAWGAGALFDGGTQEEGKTMDSGTLTTGDGKAGKKKPAPANEHALKTIAVDAQYVMATSANAKKNKWTKPLRLPKKLKLDKGTSERERRNMNAATGSGKEFEGYRLGSDIDHFCYQATMEYSEYIRPQARPHQWAKEDVSQRRDKKNKKKMVSVKKK